MTTRDKFLDLLEAPVSLDARRAIPRKLVPHERAMLAHDGYLATPAKAAQVASVAEVQPAERPDFADDIDLIVESMVAGGDVVFDLVTGAYRRPHCRRWCFAATPTILTRAG